MFLKVSDKYSNCEGNTTLIPLEDIAGEGLTFINSNGIAGIDILYYSGDELKNLSITVKLKGLMRCSLFIESFLKTLKEKVEKGTKMFDVDNFIESFIEENKDNKLLDIFS